MASRIRLPYIDLKNWTGLYTKSSTDVLSPEQLKVATNVDFFDKYGAISKLKGSSRVLSSKYQEAAQDMPISWIGFYKSTELSGAILRHVLVAAGTHIRRVNGSSLEDVANTSTGAAATSGRTSGIFGTHDQLDRFLYFTNHDPDIVGRGDQMVKYDGARFSNWGVTPPGSQESIREPFSNAASFTPTNCTATDDSVTTFDGDSVQINQTAGPLCSIEKTITPFSVISDGRETGLIGGLSEERLQLWLYIPRGQLDNANTATLDPVSNLARVFSIYLGADASNYWRFDYQKGDLVEGWNLVKIDIATAITNDGPVPFGESGFNNFTSGPFGDKVGVFDPDPAGAATQVAYIKFEFNSNGTNFEALRLDRFARLDQGAPTVFASGAGTFSGSYRWRVSFVNKYGHESNIGPRSQPAIASNNNLFYLEHIPVAEDLQVISRRLYRTVAGGTLFLRLTEIPNNVDTEFTDDTPDGGLSEITLV